MQVDASVERHNESMKRYKLPTVLFIEFNGFFVAGLFGNLAVCFWNRVSLCSSNLWNPPCRRPVGVRAKTDGRLASVAEEQKIERRRCRLLKSRRGFDPVGETHPPAHPRLHPPSPQEKPETGSVSLHFPSPVVAGRRAGGQLTSRCPRVSLDPPRRSPLLFPTAVQDRTRNPD